MKKIAIILICSLFLTGCFDRKELNDIGIVLALAVDKDNKTSEFAISCEIVRPDSLKKEGLKTKPPVEIITANGLTMFEAIRNISKKFDRKAYFAHNKVIIISEQLAKEGINPVLDVFLRNPETRPLVWIVIAKNTDAKELLTIKRGLANIQALYLNDIIKKSWATSEVKIVSLLEFYKRLLGNGRNPIAGVMEVQNKELQLVGTAVFKKDKLVGYLNDKETRGLNWITGDIKKTIINVPSTTQHNKFISVEVKLVKSKIKPQLQNGKILFNIEVNTIGNIGETQDSNDVTDLESLEAIEAAQQTVVEKEIRMTIDKCQHDLHSDVIGFGNALNKSYPREWSKASAKWPTIFPSVPYKLKVKASIQRTGKILKPIEAAQ